MQSCTKRFLYTFLASVILNRNTRNEVDKIVAQNEPTNVARHEHRSNLLACLLTYLLTHSLTEIY